MRFPLRKYAEEYKILFRLGLPVMVTQLGVIIVSFADTMMIGNYGTDELAAAAFVNSLFIVVGVMMIGFAGGTTPLIGALYSQKKHVEAGTTARVALNVNILLSLSLTVIMGILYFFLDNMGQPPHLLPIIRRYYIILLASLLPMAVFNVCQQTANGTTDTASPMWMIIGANIINITGNYILIHGKFGFPEMGLAGAGIATLAARIFASVGMLMVIMMGRRYRVYRVGMGRHENRKGISLNIWKTSYPPMIQSGIECLLWSLGAVVCGWYGTVQMASYQIVNTIAQLGFMTFMSFAVATSIRVANKAGLKDAAGMRLTAMAGMHMNIVLAMIASIVFVAFAHDLLGFFTKDRAVIAAGEMLILPLVIYQFNDAIQLTYANAQRGTAVVKPLLWTSLICYILIGVPALLGLGWIADLGNVGVYYSFDITLLAASIALVLYFYSTMRRKTAEWD